MLKQGIHLKLGQSLSMTPQLQQAIKMLQLSSMELEQEIQNVLETNPLLERAETSEADLPETEITAEKLDNNESLSETIPEELSTDSEWEDTYDTEWKVSNGDGESASDYIEKLHSNAEGLTEHLLWQIDLSNLSVGAKDLGQGLWLQFDYHFPDHPLRKKAKLLLDKNLDLLSKRDYKSIKKEIRLNSDQLDSLIELLKVLNPYPASAFADNNVDYIKPDVYVRKVKWF